MTRILVVDNHDSFVYNLVQYIGELGADCVVRRNDECTVAEIATMDLDGILLSPGPGTPEAAGICIDTIREFGGEIPIFGVCLGHQAIAVAYGGVVDRAPELLHGKTSLVQHEGVGVLAGLPTPFTATRYHSLAARADSLPAELEVTGTTPSGLVMALRHRDLDIEGVQFHPESVLTEGGHLMVATWLARCGSDVAIERAPALSARLDARAAVFRST